MVELQLVAEIVDQLLQRLYAGGQGEIVADEGIDRDMDNLGQRRFQHGQLAQGVVGEDDALFAHLFRRLRNIERVVRNALEIGDRVQEFRGVLVLL